MAKKSSNSKLFLLLGVLAGIAAIAMFFLPMINATLTILGIKNEVVVTGFNMIFDLDGCKASIIDGAVVAKTSTEFVIIPLISFICTIVGILALLATAAVGKKNKMLVKVVAFLCFIASAVLIVALTKSSYMSANNLGDAVSDFISLGVGAFICCGCNAVAGLLSLAA